MLKQRTVRVRSFSSLLAAGAVASTAIFSACAEDPEGLFDQTAGAGGTTGGSGGTGTGEAGDGTGGTSAQTGGTGATGGKGSGGAVGSGGSKATGGTGSGGKGGSNEPGTGGSSTESGGTGGGDEGGMGGDDGAGGEMDAGGTGGTGGNAGGSAGAGGGQGGSPTAACLYTSPPSPAQGGAAGVGGSSGSGGAGGALPYDINVRVGPTVGKYLTDKNGMTLYIRTSDLPGDCQDGNPPVSRCTQANGACSTTWPVYDAGARTLDPTLNPDAFGTILREDGLYQTTYMGWPLYLYLSDVAPGQIVGQSKGKVWYVAEVRLPNVVIMQEGSVRYLADGSGRTLYASSLDVLGTDLTDPLSNCDSTCLQTYEPFREPRLYAVQSLEQEDFTTFVNSSGALQVAYKGAPLYRARTDTQGGDLTGVLGTFALVLP